LPHSSASSKFVILKASYRAKLKKLVFKEILLNTEYIHKFYVLPTQCIYVFCVDLRTNSDYFTVQH
jgi:hypothetical protein